jgi:phosphoglycolate phosphatase-like HAD superfamily hydrolase
VQRCPEARYAGSDLLAPVVLFDLDGTVLTFEGPSPGPGRSALERAMREVHAFDGATDGLRVAGGTDRALVRSMLRRAGKRDDDAAIARVLASYATHLKEILEVRRYRPVGHVGPAVEALHKRGAIVGIATGNTREGAQLKLASAGLASCFDLRHGGFGSDAELRAEIVRIAAGRCGDPDCRCVVVVGDTEQDVLAGREVGARVVGVAANDRARQELEAAGADAIVEACGEELVRAVVG